MMRASERPATDRSMLIRPEIQALPAYRPGVEYEDDLEAGGQRLARMDSNEAPWPPFPEALDAIRRASSELNRYPEISCRGVQRALAECHGADPTRIVIGGGSGSLIRSLALVLLRPNDEVLVPTPPYPAYLVSTALMGGVVRRVPVVNGACDLATMLERVGPRTKLAFIANPHNPTGSIVRRAAFEDYLERVPGHVVTVLDEAYHEYVSDPEYPDGRAYIDIGKPLIVLRTFSKAYGLAGLRVGYAFATPDLSEALNRARENYPLTSLGQVAAVASLPRQDLVRERAEATAIERSKLKRACNELGLAYTPTEANFLFVDVCRDSDAVCASLQRRGVLVRSGHVHGAPTWIRVTLGWPEENEQLVAALREALAVVPVDPGHREGTL